MAKVNNWTMNDTQKKLMEVVGTYENGVTDEFILPTNLTENGKPVALIEKNDSIIFFNFRPDRARQWRAS